MKTTKRFENAVMKLYNAFHKNELDAMDCTACAVGIVLGHGKWYCGSGIDYLELGSDKPRDFYLHGNNNSNYSKEELALIEMKFILGVGYVGYFIDRKNKDAQFKGLCAVVEYLAELDDIPNPMDYTKLFESENDKPIYELNF
jgi:hypothetical protein